MCNASQVAKVRFVCIKRSRLVRSILTDSHSVLWAAGVAVRERGEVPVGLRHTIDAVVGSGVEDRCRLDLRRLTAVSDGVSLLDGCCGTVPASDEFITPQRVEAIVGVGSPHVVAAMARLVWA